MEKIKAFLIGDIVNSSLLEESRFRILLGSFEEIFAQFNTPYGFYMGDSLNALCEAPDALKITYLLRTLAIQASGGEAKKGIDIRIAIGIGKVDEPANELGIAKGEAFTLSGREMEKMGKKGPRLVIRCADPVIDAGMAGIGLFSDYVLKKMTIRQAEVVHELLLGKTQSEIARNILKSQPTVTRHAKAAGWPELNTILHLYDTLAGMLLFSRNRYAI